ncbi:MAG TPA: type II secretion system protein GspN [Bdellovibrionota bacterium]|jgi:type II secretion system protein N|nr:type II secretion system protein GspN [Bdellovibrionota bacterium]
MTPPSPENTIETTQEIQAPGFIARLRKASSRAFWVLVFFGSLAFFTFLKFPEARIKALIQGQVNAALAPQGISVTSQDASLSVWRGLRYTMRDVSVNFVKTGKAVRLDRLLVAPSLTALMFGKVAGSIDAEKGKSEISVGFSLKDTVADFEVDFDDVDIGKTGIAEAAAGVPAKGIINGFVELDGDLNNPPSWNGKGDVKIAHLELPPQNVVIFKLPEVGVSTSEIKFKIANGKVDLREVRLGDPKRKPPDDLTATLTGEIALQKFLMGSQLKVGARFSLSDRILQALGPLVIGFVNPGKQADGSYAYDISGSLQAPVPVPVQHK